MIQERAASNSELLNYLSEAENAAELAKITADDHKLGRMSTPMRADACDLDQVLLIALVLHLCMPMSV